MKRKGIVAAQCYRILIISEDKERRGIIKPHFVEQLNLFTEKVGECQYRWKLSLLAVNRSI